MRIPFVIPAQAGIQSREASGMTCLEPRFRGVMGLLYSGPGDEYQDIR
jgi:hypothetical protein